jgi:hypothetical protein
MAARRRVVEGSLDPVAHAISGDGARPPEAPCRQILRGCYLLLQDCQHVRDADFSNVQVADKWEHEPLQAGGVFGRMLGAGPCRFALVDKAPGRFLECELCGGCGRQRRFSCTLPRQRIRAVGKLLGDPAVALTCLC